MHVTGLVVSLGAEKLHTGLVGPVKTLRDRCINSDENSNLLLCHSLSQQIRCMARVHPSLRHSGQSLLAVLYILLFNPPLGCLVFKLRLFDPLRSLSYGLQNRQ